MPRRPISVDTLHGPSGPAKIASALAHWTSRLRHPPRCTCPSAIRSSTRVQQSSLSLVCCASGTPNFKSTSPRGPAPSHAGAQEYTMSDYCLLGAACQGTFLASSHSLPCFMIAKWLHLHVGCARGCLSREKPFSIDTSLGLIHLSVCSANCNGIQTRGGRDIHRAVPGVQPFSNLEAQTIPYRLDVSTYRRLVSAWSLMTANAAGSRQIVRPQARCASTVVIKI